MPRIEKQIRESEQRLSAAAQRLQAARRAWRAGLRSRITSPAVLLGGLGLGFAAGRCRRTKSREKSITRDALQGVFHLALIQGLSRLWERQPEAAGARDGTRGSGTDNR